MVRTVKRGNRRGGMGLTRGMMVTVHPPGGGDGGGRLAETYYRLASRGHILPVMAGAWKNRSRRPSRIPTSTTPCRRNGHCVLERRLLAARRRFRRLRAAWLMGLPHAMDVAGMTSQARQRALVTAFHAYNERCTDTSRSGA